MNRGSIFYGLIALLMICVVPVSAEEWNWAVDGWEGWSHTASWSGTQVGPCSEFGPLVVDGHGVHGTFVNLLSGSTQGDVERVFVDESGPKWNSLTFKGFLTPSDVPTGRWMTIYINGQEAFHSTADSNPPGNGQDFEIQCSFPKTRTLDVKISQGQSPAWGNFFYANFYSLNFDRLKITEDLEREDPESPVCTALTPAPTPVVFFNRNDRDICSSEPYDPIVAAVVSGLAEDQKVDLNLTYQVTHPSTLETEKKYITLPSVGNGEYPITAQMFGVQNLWPGIPSESSWPQDEEKLVNIHFGATLFEQGTGNCITQPCITRSLDYYWNPTWWCNEPKPVPEFPSIFLPIIMISGLLGAVLLIKRTREN